MSNALALQQEFNSEQLALIKSTVAKGATNDELQLFLYRCRHMGLDPLKPGQVHFVKYGNTPGAIITGIDGFRSKAAKTGKHVGTKRGVIRDSNGKCVGGWAEVYRSDWQHPAKAEVSLIEFMADKPTWKKMPEAMIQKVAEVHALRMAFPDDLGGLYSDDEMDQASAPVRTIDAVEVKEQIPDVFKDDALEDTVITFGKYKGKMFKDVPMFELDNYLKWVIESAAKQNKEITGQVLKFTQDAEAYLTSLESPMMP